MFNGKKSLVADKPGLSLTRLVGALSVLPCRWPCRCRSSWPCRWPCRRGIFENPLVACRCLVGAFLALSGPCFCLVGVLDGRGCIWACPRCAWPCRCLVGGLVADKVVFETNNLVTDKTSYKATLRRNVLSDLVGGQFCRFCLVGPCRWTFFARIFFRYNIVG